MNILFRADSSSIIGTGHIMRDLVLAKQFKDSKIVFATQELAGNINFKIKEANYPLEILKSNDINELIFLIKKLEIDMLVIDYYGINESYEKELKEKTDVKLFVFDDTYERHYCDILLNHNISGDSKKYMGLVPKYCELRCGSKYTLLRDEFSKEKKKKRKNVSKKQKTVFIAMGGADHSNINIDILKVIKNFKDLNVNLVTTTANKNLKKLKKYCKNKKWINLYINSTKIAKLMRKSDFAIVTPSVTVNEVYFMDLPFITIKTADNQKEMHKYLKKKKFYALNTFNKVKLQKTVNKLLKSI